MKQLMVCLLLLFAMTKVQLVSAQAAELQQLALNIEKLAQFKGILSDMKRGYQVVSQGYGTIKNISEGNFKLHQLFIDGLLAVNPKLARYSKVPAIIEGQVHILSEYKAALRQFNAGGRFSPKEMDYIGRVYGNLLNKSLKNLDELTMVLTSGQLRLSDDERIKAIDRIYTEMNGKLGFLRQFNSRALIIDQYRQRALSENQVIKDLYRNH